MLSLIEKLLFVLIALAAIAFALRTIDQFRRLIGSGRGKLELDHLPQRLWFALTTTLTQRTVLKRRLWVSILHVMVAWAFVYYVLMVNLGDTLHGLWGVTFMGSGTAGAVHRFLADIFSASALLGMSGLLLRRFVLVPRELTHRDRTLLYDGARRGIRKDSLIVGLLTIGHVGGRLLENSFRLARQPAAASAQPIATLLATFWQGLGSSQLIFFEHLGFWLAFGTAFAFVFYFPRSKHLHLFFAPLNYLLQPERRSIGQLEYLDLDDEEIEEFGAATLQDLGQAQLLDAFACIMCNRCQDVCPAYATGKRLSPAALEINKRYYINEHLKELAAGEECKDPLVEFAIPPEAVWACTTCGACVEACPVGNNPMQDIVDIRRALVLMESDFPDQLQQAFRGMERAGNPWSVSGATRLDWAAGLEVPTVAERPDFELLWWVGCAPATDPRAQKTAQALARILNAAGVPFAVLGEKERCTGDSARRAGNEAVFFELALQNVETLNEALAGRQARIVTTCPHCLHTLRNEYPDYGGHYEVVHHSELIAELIRAGRLPLKAGTAAQLTFHDPCYLGRHNETYDAPRQVLQQAAGPLHEMPRRRNNSFCCGAGGAQVWKEEEEGDGRVSYARIAEAQATGATTLAVGCPFCLIMLSDANGALGEPLELKDIAELVAEGLES